MDFTTDYSRSIIPQIAASPRWYVGKLNRPKMSVNTVVGQAEEASTSPTVNLTDGTNKNVDIWFWV